MCISDENRFVILLFVIAFLLLVSIHACVYKEPEDKITKEAISICGCERICVLRLCHIKGLDSINESEYRKHCG